MYMSCRGVSSGVNSFTLMAIPCVMISGAIMNQGGLSKRIIQFCSALFSCLRGGVGIVCVAANMVFGAVSGSGTAAVAAIGSIAMVLGYLRITPGKVLAIWNGTEEKSEYEKINEHEKELEEGKEVE